jgi:hypothetical protein
MQVPKTPTKASSAVPSAEQPRDGRPSDEPRKGAASKAASFPKPLFMRVAALKAGKRPQRVGSDPTHSRAEGGSGWQ